MKRSSPSNHRREPKNAEKTLLSASVFAKALPRNHQEATDVLFATVAIWLENTAEDERGEMQDALDSLCHQSVPVTYVGKPTTIKEVIASSTLPIGLPRSTVHPIPMPDMAMCKTAMQPSIMRARFKVIDGGITDSPK